MKKINELLSTIILLIIIITYGVVLHNFSIKETYVDKDLKPYYKEVMNIILSKCNSNIVKKHIVTFKNLENNHVGLCIMNFFHFKIFIDKNSWETFTESERFQVIAHELTHCVFKEEHNDDSDHFMYHSMSDIEKNNVIKQLQEIVRRKCK